MTDTPIIFLVDDDERVLAALKRLVASKGYRVACYLSAEDFLRDHDQDAPGCAVIDLGLPGLDGFGIQDALSSGPTDRPLIFLTGRGDIPASVKAMKAGAIDFPEGNRFGWRAAMRRRSRATVSGKPISEQSDFRSRKSVSFCHLLSPEQSASSSRRLHEARQARLGTGGFVAGLQHVAGIGLRRAIGSRA